MSELVVPGGSDDRLATAKARADGIRAGLENLSHTIDLILQSYVERDWQVLGYGGWKEYIDGEFGSAIPKLPMDQTRDIIIRLREAGMTTRTIAQAVGRSHSKVGAIIRESGVKGTILGWDGKSYPADMGQQRTKPSPELLAIRESHQAVQKQAMLNADPNKVTANVPMLNRLRRAYAPLRELRDMDPTSAARMMPLSQARDFAEPALGAWLLAFTEACARRAEREGDDATPKS